MGTWIVANKILGPYGRICPIGLPKGRPQGHLIPVGGRTRYKAVDNLLLVGDAAGFADPLTGEGLYYAFTSARLAAETIWALKRSGLSYTANNLARYWENCWQLFGRDLKYAVRLNKIAQRYPKLWQQALKNLLTGSPKRYRCSRDNSYRQMFYWLCHGCRGYGLV